MTAGVSLAAATAGSSGRPETGALVGVGMAGRDLGFAGQDVHAKIPGSARRGADIGVREPPGVPAGRKESGQP